MKKDDKAPEFLTVEIKDTEGKSWGVVHAMPRNFNTGSVEYFGNGKISNLENPMARYQFNVNIMLIGSKPRKT